MIFILGEIGSVKGQRVYATATANGATPGIGGTAGAFGNTGSPGIATVANATNINGTKNTSSADLTANSGGPGTGLGAGAGTASTAYITITFTGTTPKTGNPIYFKGTPASTSSGLLNPLLDPLGNRVSIQALNGVTPVGSAILLSTLNINSDNEYIFNAPGDITSIKLTVTSDVGHVPVLNLLAGGVSTASLKLYYAYYVAPPTVPGTTICSGDVASLAVTSPKAGVTYNWYNVGTGGTPLSTVSTYSPTLTNATTATITTNFYVEAVDGGFSSARAPVTVTINPVSVLTSTLTPTAICSGGVFSYIPASTITPGTTITWTRALVAGISNTASSGSGTATETLYNTTTAPVSVIYKYTLTTATCSKTQDITVTVNPTPALSPVANQTICLGQSIELTTLNPMVTNGVSGTYSWYDAPGGGTPLASTLLTPAVGTKTYYVRYTTSNGCYEEKSLNLTVNDLPALTIANPAITIPEATASVSLQATTNATNINWYTSSGNLAGTGSNITIVPPPAAGTYIYTVIVDNGPGTCSSTANVTISVYSTTICPPLKQRVYANEGTTTSGSVTDAGFAADGDPKTASMLSSPINLLGLGAATQNLTWNTTVAAGTPVTIKFGPGVNLLGLGSGISVIAFKKTGSIITPIGSSQSMNAALLTLLPGTNMLEYTFVPTNATGIPQTYDGIKITLNALLSLGLTANIYEAYYYTTASSLDCSKDVLDVLAGAEAPLGLGVATATVNVTNPWGAVDNSGTPAVLTNTVGVAAYAKERIIFSSQSLPGDSLKIVTSVTGTILNLGLLGGFSIQRYLGNSPVGALITGNSSLLTLKLLEANTKAALILAPMAEPYDAIEIRLGNVVSAFNSLNIHQVQRIGNTRAIDADANNYIEVCEGKTVTLPTTSCTTFEWYETASGGTPVYTGQSLNTVGLTGTKVYYIQPVRYDCRNMPRGVLTVKVNPLTIILGAFPSVCQGINDAALPYSGLSCASKYNLTWDSAATTAGFTVVSDATLDNGIIPITIPGGPLAVPATYNGFLTISNEVATSASIPFSITINPKPPAPHVTLITNAQY